jgi:predicted transcriptional regulator
VDYTYMNNPDRYESPLKLFSLGSLESEVLAILCETGGGSVRDVCRRLSRPLAYTTVMTTLDRLYKKELLLRSKEGRSFLYTPRLAGQIQKGQQDATPVVQAQTVATRVALISYLLDAVGNYDEALLQELEKTIAARRQQFEREEKL